MRQFDVHRRMGDDNVLLVIMQADVVSDLNVVVVAPLYPASLWDRPARHLHPSFDIDGHHYVLVTNHLAAVATGTIGSRVAALADKRHDIVNALDFLFTGI